MSEIISNLLLGYNSSAQYVIAVSDGRVIFVNNAAASVADGNYIGCPVAEMLGEEVSGRTLNLNTQTVVTLDGVNFFDDMCKLEILPGEPTLFIFTPAEKNETDTLAALSAFAFTLRSPLSELFMARDGLRRHLENDDNDKVMQYVGTIDRSSYNILHMLNRVSMLSNISLPDKELRMQQGNLTMFCEKVVANTADAVHALGIPLVFKKSPAVSACFDMRKIEQALLCLLSNALKYTREGNEITVSVSSGEQHCYVNVTDSGAGIPPEVLATIGEIQRSDRPSSGNSTGLGLRVVREIAALHGGSIILESQPGVGTSVTFSLELKNEPTGVSNTIADIYEPAQPYLNELSGLLKTSDFAELRRRVRSGEFLKSNS